MLNSQNCGKYLYGKWARDRNRAVEDKSGFTTAEQTWLEITGIEGTNFYQKEAYLIDTNPVDPKTNPKREAIDIRQLPTVGG
jgi:hypothetical protein